MRRPFGFTLQVAILKSRGIHPPQQIAHAKRQHGYSTLLVAIARLRLSTTSRLRSGEGRSTSGASGHGRPSPFASAAASATKPAAASASNPNSWTSPCPTNAIAPGLPSSRQRDRRSYPSSSRKQIAAIPSAASTVRAARSVSGLIAPLTGKRRRRRAASESTVCCSAYAIVTPPWLSLPSLFLKDGVMLPWLISEGLILTGSSFALFSAPDSSNVHPPPTLRKISTLFSMASGSMRLAVRLPSLVVWYPTISDTNARCTFTPRPPRGPVESQKPKISAVGHSSNTTVAFPGFAAFNRSPKPTVRNGCP